MELGAAANILGVRYCELLGRVSRVVERSNQSKKRVCLVRDTLKVRAFAMNTSQDLTVYGLSERKEQNKVRGGLVDKHLEGHGTVDREWRLQTVASLAKHPSRCCCAGVFRWDQPFKSVDSK